MSTINQVDAIKYYKVSVCVFVCVCVRLMCVWSGMGTKSVRDTKTIKLKVNIKWLYVIQVHFILYTKENAAQRFLVNKLIYIDFPRKPG